MHSPELLQSLELWIEHYGAWTVFVLLYLESFGIPLPGASVLIAGSLLAAIGKFSLPILLITAFIACVLGDCTGYMIGHFGGTKLLTRYGYLVKLTPQRLEKFHNALNNKGFYFVASARFIIVARQLNGIIAGSGTMAFHKFLVANIIGAFAWVLFWGTGPYLLKIFFI